MSVQTAMPETVMSLVPSLLQAIVRVDGEALVMHVGEKPYVVSPNGQIDLATRGLTFDAVNGLVSQLLPPDAMKSLEEVGATQFELPPLDEFPGEHFTVTAARGGDDVWAEIRRRPAPDDDLAAVDLFAGFTTPDALRPPPAADDLVLPQERQLWPTSAPQAETIQAPAGVDDHRVVMPESATASASVTISDPGVIETAGPATPPAAAMPADDVSGPVAPDVIAPLPARPDEPVSRMEVVEPSSSATEVAPLLDIEPVAVDRSAAVHDMDRAAVESMSDEPAVAEMIGRDGAAADAAVAVTTPVDGHGGVTEPPVLASPVEPVADAPAESPVALAPLGGEPTSPAAAAAVAPAPNVSQTAIANWLAEFATAAILHKPEAQSPAGQPAAGTSPATDDAPVDTPAEPAVSVTEPEPESAPAFVTLSAPPSTEVRAADRESEADMSTPPQEFHPFAPSTPAMAASAPEPFTASRLGAVEPLPASPQAPIDALPVAPRPVSSFVPFPSLADQPQSAVVLPIGRGGRDGAASEQAAAGLERLLRLAASRGATALYLSSGTRPSVRLDGDVQTLDGTAPLGAGEIDALLLGAAAEPAALQANAGGTAEWVMDLTDVGAVRCTSFRDHRGPGAVFRIVAVRPQSAAQLGLSREIQGLVSESEGLVLVSGPRANGKSTLLSSLVDVINRTRRDYVITIESEVNVVHERQGAFVSQREVRGGSDDALAAARAALREDPDVLVIDDLRTAGLMSVALDAAANGQLVIGGVPAHHASGAVERLIDMYQPEHRRQVQLAVAQHLRGVVSQVLLRKSGGGRVAAREVLLNTPIVSSLLAEGRLNQLPMAIEGGRKSGMVPLNDALVGFVQSGAVDVRDAYRRAVDRAGLLDLLKRQGIDTSVVERLA